MSRNSAVGPLFVVGMWRSGTSLLYALLNQHPEVALMYESDLPLLRPLFHRGRKRVDWWKRWEFWNSAPSRHQLASCDAGSDDLRSTAEKAWKEYAGLATIYGDKSPNYYDSLRALAREFPNARFVVIWRDLHDICRSILEARESSSFFSKRGIFCRAIVGYARLKSECNALASLGVPLCQIQYEELTKNPAEVMDSICRFLQIRFDGRMRILDGADRSAIYKASHHRGVKGDAIVASARRDDVLPGKLRWKIDRYISYWQGKTKVSWPRYPIPRTPNPKVAGSMERWWDALCFHALRAFDKFTVLVYCYAPLRLLQAYRSSQAQPQAAAAVKAESPALAQVSLQEADRVTHR